MDDDAKRLEFHKRVYRDWLALKHACYLQHPKGVGGAAMCYCGKGCGSSAACAMLQTVRTFLEALEPEQVPEMWREWLRAVQRTA